jgi:hypothetical protein
MSVHSIDKKGVLTCEKRNHTGDSIWCGGPADSAGMPDILDPFGAGGSKHRRRIGLGFTALTRLSECRNSMRNHYT